MPLTIPDDVLAAAHLTEQDARIEIACRLFQAGRLTKPEAARWSGMSRVEFETALLDRGIPLYAPTIEEITSDYERLVRLGTRK